MFGAGVSIADDADNASLQDGLADDALTANGYEGTSNEMALAAAQKKYTAPIPDGGPLLEQADESKVFRSIDKDVLRQEPLAKRRCESQKHWEFVRAGCSFSVLNKSEDQSVYRQDFPPGIDNAPLPIPNKIDDVCTKMVSQVIVDTPLPKAIAEGDDDRSRMAQDLTRKFLRADATADGTNDPALWRDALDMNQTGRSSFVVVWVDPMGGGWRPKQINAHPSAPDATNPMMGPKLDPNGQPVIDPATNQPMMERTGDPVLRYVAEGPPAEDDPSQSPTLQFTTDPAAAARQWLPKVKRLLMPAAMVRTFPKTADAFSAQKITLLMWGTLDEAKQRFPVLAAMSDDQLKMLIKWRPKRWQALVPPEMLPKGDDNDSAIHGDALFFWYHHYCRIGPVYQDGAEIAVTGGSLDTSTGKGFVLLRDTLREDVELDDGTTVPVLMDPPVSQFKGLNDVKGGDPFGIEPISRFGGAGEFYASLMMSVIEAIDRGLHPNMFLGADSPVTREDMNRRDGTPIDITKKDDLPIWEQAPVLPGFVPALLDKIEVQVNSLAGTNETSNGLDSSYSTSGVAKEVAISQAKVALAVYWQNFIDGVTYYWTLKTRLAQAKLTVPMRVKLAGQDSAFKQRYWVGADLFGTSKAVLQPGSGTMQNATQKLQTLQVMLQLGATDPEEAGELARSSMSDDLGLAPNVHKERANRQVADWLEGPPKGWMDQYQANQKAQQGYAATLQQTVAALTSQGIDARSAQQQAQQQSGPPPQPTPLYSPFVALPNDSDGYVAKIRAGVFSRFMATVDYMEQPEPWRAVFNAAYTQAFSASGGQTVAQQQAAAQANAQPDATYAAFKADIDKRVTSLIATDLAKQAAGVAPPAPAPTEPAGPAPIDPMALAHESSEASAERMHQASENAKDRVHDMNKLAVTGAQKLDHATTTAALRPPPVARPALSPA